jgi:hypothetical protein
MLNLITTIITPSLFFQILFLFPCPPLQSNITTNVKGMFAILVYYKEFFLLLI